MLSDDLARYVELHEALASAFGRSGVCCDCSWFMQSAAATN
jgi:hypothetical protein